MIECLDLCPIWNVQFKSNLINFDQDFGTLETGISLPKEIYPEKPKNKTYHMKHTKPNLSDQNLPIETYHTKPSKVDL